MTLIFEIIGGFILYTVLMAFWPYILTGAFGLLCLWMTLTDTELGNGGRALALLGVFAAVWVCWKMAESYRQERRIDQLHRGG